MDWPLIPLDEFFFFDPEWFDVFPPVPEVSQAILTTSIPPDGDNPLMRMIDTKFKACERNCK